MTDDYNSTMKNEIRPHRIPLEVPEGVVGTLWVSRLPELPLHVTLCRLPPTSSPRTEPTGLTRPPHWSHGPRSSFFSPSSGARQLRLLRAFSTKVRSDRNDKLSVVVLRDKSPQSNVHRPSRTKILRGNSNFILGRLPTLGFLIRSGCCF